MSNKSKCQSLIEEYFSQYPQETKDNWEKFVTGRLAETNERNKIIPPAQYANKHSSSDDEDSDFKDIAFPQESSSAQVPKTSTILKYKNLYFFTFYSFGNVLKFA